jgi:hypothetical protein
LSAAGAFFRIDERNAMTAPGRFSLLLLNFKSFRLRFVPDEKTRAATMYSEPDLPQVTAKL